MQDSDPRMTADIVRQAAQAVVASVLLGSRPPPSAAPTAPLAPSPAPTPQTPVAPVSQSTSQPSQEFSGLPSSPAQPLIFPQAVASIQTVDRVAPRVPAPQGRVQNIKTSIAQFWRSYIWNGQRKILAQRIGRVVAIGMAVWFAYVAVMVVAYRFVDPPASNLMIYNYLKGNTVQHTWVPMAKISPAVIKAVVVAEDAQFCRHWGIDFAAIQYAIEHARGGTPRGASTITMQTAKNMFLWQSKSYIRKILEVPVTLMIELIWPKKRILEIYLNIAEWGPGVFGIGAAAKHHFKTSAANLNTAAAARLAASLPNPKVRRAGRPGPKTRRKANVIRGRARHAGYYTGCVLR